MRCTNVFDKYHLTRHATQHFCDLPLRCLNDDALHENQDLLCTPRNVRAC